jgi:hypothetical protein
MPEKPVRKQAQSGRAGGAATAIGTFILSISNVTQSLYTP